MRYFKNECPTEFEFLTSSSPDNQVVLEWGEISHGSLVMVVRWTRTRRLYRSNAVRTSLPRIPMSCASVDVLFGSAVRDECAPHCRRQHVARLRVGFGRNHVGTSEHRDPERRDLACFLTLMRPARSHCRLAHTLCEFIHVLHSQFV